MRRYLLAMLACLVFVAFATLITVVLHLPQPFAGYQTGFWTGVLYMWLTQ